ncbi:hypothetical protein M426DRAFT_13719 [Hypoxylon sp. CI-4A]|nr:hypothetical protein M426DRAFT_13719 [Hypoxylon sp. CI-4A]
MCYTVQYTYRCGCTESTTFECPNKTSHPRRRRRCSGACEVTKTKLDETCHDCSQKASKPTSTGKTVPAGVMSERPANLPTKSPANPMLDSDETLQLSEIPEDLLELFGHDFFSV